MTNLYRSSSVQVLVRAMCAGIPELKQGSGEEGDRTGGTLQVFIGSSEMLSSKLFGGASAHA